MKHFDYIIAGGGLSGLSLAFYLNRSKLRNKSILIIDKEEKNKNDRNWCYWNKDVEEPFADIIWRKWSQVYFYGQDFEDILKPTPYSYNWIRGIDFYSFVLKELKQNPNIHFLYDSINYIQNEQNYAFVSTFGNLKYAADYVFDSIYKPKLNDLGNHNMLQHFKGWKIKTKMPKFDPNLPVMMDYRVEQRGAGVRFVYVLPEDEHIAMVEYTVFSDALLEDDEYEEELRKYINNQLKIIDYEIVEEEYGIIPMTDEPLPEQNGERIIRIGTAGGYVKASSGYAFKATQVFVQQMVANLIKTGKPFREKPTFNQKFKKLLDSTLLNVLLKQRHSGKDIFTRLYQHNKTPTLFQFLDEETTLWQDLGVMTTVPIKPFILSFVEVLKKRIFR